MPVYPNATQAQDPPTVPLEGYPTDYLKSATRSYVSTGSITEVERWYLHAFQGCGFPDESAGMSFGHTTPSRTITFDIPDVANGSVELVIRKMKQGHSLIVYSAFSMSFPVRPRVSLLPDSATSVFVNVTSGQPPYSLNHVFTSRSAIELLADTFNAQSVVSGYVVNPGGCRAGSVEGRVVFRLASGARKSVALDGDCDRFSVRYHTTTGNHTTPFLGIGIADDVLLSLANSDTA